MTFKNALIISLILLHPMECLANPTAGIVPDTTLGNESSKLNIYNGNTTSAIEITGGAKRKSALFHSFSEFNIPKNNSAFFETQPDIQTIFARVLSNKSYINGVIGVRGNSNLVILNPNGFSFGNGAQLNLTGSFSAITANNIKFKNFSFGTKNPSIIPKTTNLDTIPVFMEFSSQSGSIDINNSGIPLLQPDSSLLPPVAIGDISSGLTNASGGDLAFIGNKVNLNGAIINLLFGDLTLASIKEGIVYFDSRNGQISNYFFPEATKNDLNITNNSFILNSNFSESTVKLVGHNILLLDSSLNQVSQGPFSTGTIQIDADNNLTINRSSNTDLPLGFKRNIPGILSINRGDGNGSNIKINSKNTSVDNGGIILTSTFSDGKAGDISIKSDILNVDNSSRELQSRSDSGSTISSATQGGTGDSGSIILSTPQLSIQNGAQVSTSTLALGNAGDISIYADSVDVDGFNSKNIFPSTISSTSAFGGDSGNLSIFSNHLSIKNGAEVGTITFGSGKAKSVKIDSNRIDISGTRPDEIGGASSIYAIGSEINDNTAFIVFGGVPLKLSGDSGNIEIKVKSLSISDGGDISAENSGPGLGGSVDIKASESIILNSSQITSSTRGSDGGKISLFSKYLVLDRSLIAATSEGGGAGGIISIDSDLFLVSKSSLSASANGFGTGGNVGIESIYSSIKKSSSIKANAVNNQAGNIIINSNNVSVDRSSSLTATSNLGANSSGEVIVNQRQDKIQLDKNIPEIDDSPIALKSECSSGSNNSVITNHGLGKDTVLLSERQKKARYLKQRIEFASQFYYIDSETGEKMPYKPLLAIEENDDGNLELIFSPEQSQGLQNLLSSLDNICQIKS